MLEFLVRPLQRACYSAHSIRVAKKKHFKFCILANNRGFVRLIASMCRYSKCLVRNGLNLLLDHTKSKETKKITYPLTNLKTARNVYLNNGKKRINNLIKRDNSFNQKINIKLKSKEYKRSKKALKSRTLSENTSSQVEKERQKRLLKKKDEKIAQIMKSRKRWNEFLDLIKQQAKLLAS